MRAASNPLSGLRQLSMRRRVECNPGRERESQERGTVSPSTFVRLLGAQDEEDTPSVCPSALQGKITSFGPFRLHVTERLLEKNGTALKIGSRAMDILMTLLEHAPEAAGWRQPRETLGCSGRTRQSVRASRADLQPILGGLPDTRPRCGR